MPRKDVIKISYVNTVIITFYQINYFLFFTSQIDYTKQSTANLKGEKSEMVSSEIGPGN